MIADERFNKAVKMVLRHEGRLSNDRDDKGEITNYGVSLRFLRQAVLDMNNDGEINELDVVNLTVEQAKQIYFEHWWQRYKYHQIKDDRLATRLLDLSINMGAYQAHKLLQRAINEFRNINSLKIDGIFGTKTLKAVNDLSTKGYAKHLYEALKDEAANFYVTIVSKDRTLRKYLHGWLNRLND